MRPTPSQLRVILSGDRHLLVSAGAGSGKTSTVVSTLCYRLGGTVVDADGVEHRHPAPLTLREIAAITFTNQAAADLKRKLRAALTSAGLRALATEVDSARIGTIHGFCGELLRDCALRAGLPPSLRILEDGEASTLAAETAREVVQQAVLAGDAGLPALLKGRRLVDLLSNIITLSSDRARLAAWERNASALREHERALLRLAQQCADSLVTKLAHAGALDFERMISETRRLLIDEPVTRRAVQRGLRLLVVDEYQDVDPHQRDIARSLGGMIATDPNPTRVMFVGDPKQSIYRFRRADVTLWNETASRFREGSGDVLELSDNFRSRRGILAFVDRLVGERLAAPVHADGVRRDFEVDYAPLVACGPDAEGDECVELLCVAAAEGGKARGADETRAIEARGVAERIASMAASGEPFGDMAILLGSWSDLETYQQALRAAGVPFYALRAEGFWETREVVDCLLALRAIRDPRDHTAMLGTLKGPFVGVRDDTLMALAETARERASSVFEILAEVEQERPLLDRARELLTHYGALRDRLPIHELLARLLRESGFTAAMSLDRERGAQRVANVRKLLRIAEAQAESSLGEFLRDVSERRARAEREGEERLYRERADVVTITSVHSAKGLEWPIVFWCDLVRESRPDHSALQCGRDRFHLQITGDVDDDVEHAALKQEIAVERSAESFRLWYVAATRPRRLLVLSGIPLGAPRNSKKEGAEQSVVTLLRRRFPELFAEPAPTSIAYTGDDGTSFRMIVRVAEPVGDEAANRHGVGAGRRSEPGMLPDAPPEPITASGGRSRLSATQLMTFANDPGLWADRYVRGVERPVGHRRAGEGGRARELGVVVHDVLERYGYDLADIAELIEGAIERHDPDAPEADSPAGIGYRASIREIVERAASHPRWRELRSAEGARTELPFTRLLPDGSTIEGKLDLAAPAASGVGIIDAKTGSTPGTELPERYRIQGAVYREAVEAITGRPASFELLSTADGIAVPAAECAEGVPALVERLRSYRIPSRT